MPAPVPTMETVITAIKAAMDAIVGLGTTLTGFHGFEDDVEFIERGSHISSGSMNLFFIDLESVEEIEGPATGEVYERYNIQIRFWSLRTADTGWSAAARAKAELVRDALSDAATVFAIGGQYQVQTPTTVSVRSHGEADIRGTEGGQKVFLTTLELAVEARRFLA
jgi:hypothetical protein